MNRIIDNLILTDDDEDYCTFFQIALDEVLYSAKFKVVKDDVRMMNLLKSRISPLADVLLLDLTLPLKPGLQCLEEIRKDQNIKNLVVVIFSTSYSIEYIDELYKIEATYYIQKPEDFFKFKKVVEKVLVNSAQIDNLQIRREGFILKP